MNQELRRVFKVARKQGWVITRTRNSHWRLVPPYGDIVIHAGSNLSGPRAFRELLSDLRRSGLEINR